ncbi:MAG: right-handed parallel beta-helix repeat-containing protein, partial [Thermoanaerobaculia bacterium]
PGVVLYLKAGVAITVLGALLAEGTEASPIRFTRYGDGARWKQIKLVKAAASRFAHAVFEYADSEGAHQDSYEPGPRDYHEAIVVLASHLDLEGCVFRKLPDEGAAAEGDALAVISDDPDDPGPATATVKGCRFLAIGQGVHTRYSHVLVEDCYFTGKRGDNDDVDLWGESDPPPVIRRNRLIDPEHDDMINPTRCSAVIVGNFLTGGDDHGIVLRDKGSPVVINNVIENCASGGIAIENSCTALLVNNTVVDCGRGLRLFDLGRWDAPYFLNPGGGTATVVNCVIWDCPEPITLADSSNTQIQDKGSHVTVLHSDIEGGRAGVSVSGAQSTVTWGAGNIALDPQFVDPAQADYRLKPGSPALEAGTAEGAPATDLEGNPRPCGSGIDLGAYESCPTGPATFRRADPNGDRATDLSDALAVLFYLFAAGREPACLGSADADDDGAVRVSDSIAILGFLFLQGDAPPAPHPGCGLDPTEDELGCGSPSGCP